MWQVMTLKSNPIFFKSLKNEIVKFASVPWGILISQKNVVNINQSRKKLSKGRQKTHIDANFLINLKKLDL